MVGGNHFNTPWARKRLQRHQIPVTGRIGLSLMFFLGPLLLCGIAGTSRPVGVAVAFVTWAGIELALWRLRKWRLARVHAQVQQVQAQLDGLREVDLKLRVAEAEASGAFDRFGDKT